MSNRNLLKSRVSEIRVKRIRVNQGVGVIATVSRDRILAHDQKEEIRLKLADKSF